MLIAHISDLGALGKAQYLWLWCFPTGVLIAAHVSYMCTGDWQGPVNCNSEAYVFCK